MALSSRSEMRRQRFLKRFGMIREEGLKPALIVGVPVGFVSAAESKEAVRALTQNGLSDIPYIVARGRKGGSTIAVSIIHALLLLSTREKLPMEQLT